MKPGFYHLYSSKEPIPTLVHGYNCTDLNGEFVFGFNTHDGGGLVSLSDLTEDTIIVPVNIVEISDNQSLKQMGVGSDSQEQNQKSPTAQF